MRGWRRRGKLAYCMSDGETSISTGSSYREAVSTLHVTLKNGSDLYVNEQQKIRHYRGRSTGE